MDEVVKQFEQKDRIVEQKLRSMVEVAITWAANERVQLRREVWDKLLGRIKQLEGKDASVSSQEVV